MMNRYLTMKSLFNSGLIMLTLLLISLGSVSQTWMDYSLTPNGDTINRVDQKKLRQGPWVVRYEEVRGEPGYEEEGYFIDDKKNGPWLRYSLMGDLIAREFYKWGYREGKQQYYTAIGDLQREESWKSVNPANPYDTIVVPDIDHPDMLIEKVIKHESAEVRNGKWIYYNTSTGDIVKTEFYIFGQLDKKNSTPLPGSQSTGQEQSPSVPAKPALPKAVQQYQKKKGKD
jgi:hypothetical protein